MTIAARLRTLRDFDLYEKLEEAGARFADVPGGTRLRTKVRAVVASPKKLAIVVGVILGFSAALVSLFLSGVLGEVYEAIYTFWPGRPWTHVMREKPWIYLALAILFLWLPYTLSPPTRWGRAFVSYVVFWAGFLGGHVFW